MLCAGTQSKQQITERLRSYAVYIANLFFLTSDALAPVVKDVDMTAQQIGEWGQNEVQIKGACGVWSAGWSWWVREEKREW